MTWRSAVAAAALGAVLGTSSISHADVSSQDKASAEAMFRDGMKLMSDKDYSAACPKLEESQRLDPGMGTQFRLAECFEAQGRTASAWGNFLEVADFAKNAGQADRERVARDRAAAIESKLSRLTLVVAAEIPGLEVRRGGVVVGKAQWGSAVPVDPAAYEITATAPGKVKWTGSVTVAENAGPATLTIPSLKDAAPEVVAPAPGPAPAEPSSGVPWATVGLVTGGVGVAGVVSGAVFGFAAISKKNDADTAGCNGAICPAAAAPIRDSAQSAASASTIFLVGGGVLAAGGLVLWITAPRHSAVTVGVAFPGMVQLGGRW